MFVLRYLILTTLLAISMVFSTQAIATANLGISPTQILLSPSNKTSIVTLINKGDMPVNLQLNAKSWDMDENGKFIETDSSDFIFYPKTLTIKPQEQASIRVGYLNDIPKAEKPYRLFIEEIPEIIQNNLEQNKIKVGLVSALRLSLPLYVVPVNDTPVPQVELGDIRAENQRLRIGVKNVTAYHVTLKKVAVKLLKGNTTLLEKTVELKLQRILGEHQVFVDIPMDANKLCQQADTIAVEIDVDNLSPSYQTKVSVKPSCQL